jgi:hypothetical protein
MRRNPLYMLYHVCCFVIEVVLNLLNICAVGIDGCTVGEVNNNLHRLGLDLVAVH